MRLKADAPSKEVDTKICELLSNEQYFRICNECGERNPCGWMHSQLICQSWAERNHGVIY